MVRFVSTDVVFALMTRQIGWKLKYNNHLIPTDIPYVNFLAT